MLKALGIVSAVVLGLFAISFIVYFFNFDMKLTSKIYPLLQRHYDRISRDKHL